MQDRTPRPAQLDPIERASVDELPALQLDPPQWTVRPAFGYVGSHPPVSGGMTERQVTLIRDFEPDVIMVTPSYMLAIVDEMQRQGVDPRSSSLAVGIFGAEPWTNDMRVELEQRLDMHAVDIYGLSEV